MWFMNKKGMILMISKFSKLTLLKLTEQEKKFYKNWDYINL